jgi:hypothetical protein
MKHTSKKFGSAPTFLRKAEKHVKNSKIISASIIFAACIFTRYGQWIHGSITNFAASPSVAVYSS